MSWFQLDPSSLATRARASGAKPPSLAASLFIGVVGFTIVSVAGFIPWAVFGQALHHRIGEAGLYAVCAVIFIGLSGLLLHRLIIGPGSLGRFYRLFSGAFAAYSIAWILGWMILRGHLGGAVGLLAGAIAMGSILALAFDARDQALKAVAALFVLNAAGYFGGGLVEAALIHHQPLAAKLLWGVCFGAGMGAGLGLAFYFCQHRARALLRETPAHS